MIKLYKVYMNFDDLLPIDLKIMFKNIKIGMEKGKLTEKWRDLQMKGAHKHTEA